MRDAPIVGDSLAVALVDRVTDEACERVEFMSEPKTSATIEAIQRTRVSERRVLVGLRLISSNDLVGHLAVRT